MSFDPTRHADHVVLTTREIADWMGVPKKHVLSLPLDWLPWRTRERRCLAGEVKRVVLGELARKAQAPHRRGPLQLRTGT